MESVCLRCGACCETFGTIRVESGDQVPEVYLDRLDLGYIQMKTVSGRCVCLGPDQLCEAYDQRPSTCREFKPGGKLCQEARGKMDDKTHADHEDAMLHHVGVLSRASRSRRFMAIVVHIGEEGEIRFDRTCSGFPSEKLGEALAMIKTDLERLSCE